jgi:hypothetical protein
MRWTTTQLRTFGMSLVLSAALACAGGMTLGVVYAERRPPPPRVEVITTSPGRGYTWIAGYWRWDSGDYYWTPGRWVRIQHGYTHWEPGHWREKHHRWHWVEGRWAR